MAVKEIKITKAGCAGYPVAEMIRGDSNTTLIRMYVNADQDGVDLKGLAWAVDVVNAQGVLESVKLETVEVGEMICGEWLVDGMAALDVGRTHFQLEGISDDGRTWQSGKYYIDVGERIDGEAGEGVPEQLMSLQELIAYVNDKLPQVLAAGQMAEEAGETAREAYQHPPIIGENGNWYVWDWEAAKYTDTGKPSSGDCRVSSVNGKSGAVELNADDVGAQPKGDYALKAEIYAPVSVYTGTFDLNHVYTATLGGAVTFALPAPADITRECRIRMLANVAADTSIDWGTDVYYGAAVPFVNEGTYEILWDYNTLIGAWVVGVTRIGRVVSA